MEIEIIAYPDVLEVGQSDYNKIVSELEILLGHAPQVVPDLNGLKKGHYYLLYCFGSQDLTKLTCQDFFGQIFLLNCLKSDIRDIGELYSYPPFAGYTYWLAHRYNAATINGNQEILETMNTTLDPLGGFRTRYFSYRYNESISTMDFVLRYMEQYARKQAE